MKHNLKIIKETKSKIVFKVGSVIDEWDLVEKADDYAEKKLKHFSLDWDQNGNLVAKKIKLGICPFCNKKEELIYEYENGEKVYKICCACWIRLNS